MKSVLGPTLSVLFGMLMRNQLITILFGMCYLSVYTCQNTVENTVISTVSEGCSVPD